MPASNREGLFVFMIVGKMKKPCRDCPFTKGYPIEDFSESLAEPEFACHETMGMDDELDCAGRLLMKEGIENEQTILGKS